MVLVRQIYELTRGFPSDEKYVPVAQIRRAAISVPSIIAGGQARHATKEFIQYISHAEGSVPELDTWINLGIDLGYCSKRDAFRAVELAEELRRTPKSLRRRLVKRVLSLSLVSSHCS